MDPVFLNSTNASHALTSVKPLCLALFLFKNAVLHIAKFVHLQRPIDA